MKIDKSRVRFAGGPRTPTPGLRLRALVASRTTRQGSTRAIVDPRRENSSPSPSARPGSCASPCGASSRAQWWVPFAPMRRYVDTPHEPHLGMIREPIKSFCQSKGAAGMSNDAVVKSEADHPRWILVDHALDSIVYIVKVVVARGDALPAKAHVVVHERIGNHQLVARAYLHPIWKFVVVSVTVVGVSCVEQNRSRGKRWSIARVPTFWAAPHALGDNLCGKTNVLAFRFRSEISMHLPPQPMAGDIPVRFPDSCYRFGVPLESAGDGKHGAGNVSPREHPM